MSIARVAQRFSAAIRTLFPSPALAAAGRFVRLSKAAPFLLITLLCSVLACSPRDFLTRRLAANLISASETFKAPQVFWLKTGMVSNRDFNSPDSMVLQHRGWIIGTEQKKCPPGVDPAPCWDVVLSPLGVGVFRPLISDTSPGIAPMSLRVAHRELVNINGISKAGTFADVEFTWRWVALNPVGAALYDGGVYYRSTVGFRSFDDGWRVANETARTNQSLEEALRNAEPTAP
jgi:hypothetical protein